MKDLGVWAYGLGSRKDLGFRIQGFGITVCSVYGSGSRIFDVGLGFRIQSLVLLWGRGAAEKCFVFREKEWGHFILLITSITTAAALLLGAHPICAAVCSLHS